MSKEQRVSWRSQLADAEENVRLFEEHKSKFASPTDIPIQLHRDLAHWHREIARLRELIETGKVGLATHPGSASVVEAEFVGDFSAAFAAGLPAAEFWEREFLPWLNQLRTLLPREGVQTIDLYAKAHSAAALAFGFVFRRTAGFRLKVDQNERLWDLEAEPTTADVQISSQEVAATGDVLLELSMSQPIAPAVDSWLAQSGTPIALRLQVVPVGGLGHQSVRDAGHAVAIAQAVRVAVEAARRTHPGATVHVFDAVPLVLAVCLGRELNVVSPIQTYLYDKERSGYTPAVILRA